MMMERQKLPSTVQLASIAEVVLKDAPFITGGSSSRSFWRSHLTSVEFQHLMTDGYWWFLAYDVQKQHLKLPGGADILQTNSPEEILRDPIFGRMAASFVNLFQRVPTAKKDMFFGHFYEAMAFGILHCLVQAHPKQRSYFDNAHFRRKLVDRCSVWTTGFRPHRVQPDHWILEATVANSHLVKGHDRWSVGNLVKSSSLDLVVVGARALRKKMLLLACEQKCSPRTLFLVETQMLRIPPHV